MNPVESFAVGIAPDHVPALVAAMVFPVLVLAVRRLRRPVTLGAEGPTPPRSPVDPVRLWASWLLGLSAAIHVALPLGHNDAPVLAIAFVGSGAAYAWLALRAYEGRSFRLLSSLLLVATLIGYLSVNLGGGEEPDQVGIATALIELTALGLCLVPMRGPVRKKRFKRFVGSGATIAATFVVGALIWVGSFAAHAATDAQVSADPDEAVETAGAIGHTADHEHAHDHAARAQAGVVMRPLWSQHPTQDQQHAAQQLASAVRAATERYANLDAALAAGYQLPTPGTGTDIHLQHKRYGQDGHILDPQRPELLVYAISGGQATLLGVVFVMERAGVAGPEPGGPITRWHAHNVCLTPLPPGFGIVTPFGNCPAFGVNVTSPEMMHVWVVDNPGGAFAEGLDKQWELDYHASHGLPYGSN